MRPRVFVSHASEDKEAVARPLALVLRGRGFDVWFDEFVLRMGDPLLESIDRGLRECDFGVVVLSKAFFSKSWPQRELAGLVAREMSNSPILLPIWHQLSVSDVAAYSPILADRFAASTTEGLDGLVDRIVAAVRPRGGPWNGVSDTEFIIPFTISGMQLFEITENTIGRQHGIDEDEIQGCLHLAFYGDGSGIDESSSGFLLADGVNREVRQKDILAILDEQPYIPRGYSVWHLGVDTDEVPDEAFSATEDLIEVRGIPKIHFTAVVDQEYVRTDELIAFVTALAHFEGGLPYDSQGSLWWEKDSPGRSVVRRLSQTGNISSLIGLLKVDWGVNYRKRPHSDYRAFCLARSIIYELDIDEARTSAADVIVALLADESPLNPFWKKRLNARLSGRPLWAYEIDEADLEYMERDPEYRDGEHPRFDAPPV